jgi:aminoglycoside phosphotransferase (APT) family kinase protein
MNLEECLPADLQGLSPTITRVGAGMSGAGVYRVEAAGQAYVLKVSSEQEPLAGWRGKLRILELAASAGLAPGVIHADEARRAVLSAFVVDRSFAALFADPRTRPAALALLGRTLRSVHGLPPPPEAEWRDPRELLESQWSALERGFALPGFVGDAVGRVLGEPSPARERALVLSHNDVNPTNLAYDGERLLLLDWDTAGLNDPFYDLAAIAMFLRMDEPSCQKLLAAYGDGPVSELPAPFRYRRRLVAALCGTIFLRLARQSGHTGATGSEALEATPSLGEFYQQLRSGALSLASGDGRWWGGLALVKESTAL